MTSAMNTPATDLTLVADVGGTNTRVSLASDGVVLRETIRRYENAKAESLQEVLAAYLSTTAPGALSGASVAIAGPVREGVGHMTNLHWRITETDLSDVTGASRVAVLNDLQAQGFALSHLETEDLTEICPQEPVSAKATRLVVGLGTGMNTAPVYSACGGHIVPPAECGHIALPQTSKALHDLANSLADRHGFASIEEALSGRGLVNIHRHLHGNAPDGKAIMEAADHGDTQAIETARLYVETLGTVMGDLALIHLPFGGLYLVGGMSRAIAPWLNKLGFRDAFCAKGRFKDFMAQFGVFSVTDDYAALKGCAAYLSERNNL